MGRSVKVKYYMLVIMFNLIIMCIDFFYSFAIQMKTVSQYSAKSLLSTKLPVKKKKKNKSMKETTKKNGH